MFASGSIQVGIFFLLRTDPAIRLWAGIGDCDGGFNDIDSASEVYRGTGILQDVPAIQSMINGKSERNTFQLAGSDPAVLALARGEAALVRGKTVHLGFGLFRRDWSALLGPIRWIWRGRADYLQETIEIPETKESPVRWLVDLSVGSAFTGRKRPQHSFYTHADQDARSPGDRFCERTPNYAQEYQKRWSPD